MRNISSRKHLSKLSGVLRDSECRMSSKSSTLFVFLRWISHSVVTSDVGTVCGGCEMGQSGTQSEWEFPQDPLRPDAHHLAEASWEGQDQPRGCLLLPHIQDLCQKGRPLHHRSDFPTWVISNFIVRLGDGMGHEHMRHLDKNIHYRTKKLHTPKEF